MATNKHATIRYHALDRCFSNPGRKYYIDDLITACNEAIYESTGTDAGVKRRQVYNDIIFMESEAGWSVPLERYADGRRKFFRYTDPSFSIRGSGVNQAELEQISDTLTILSRFKGLPHFEWIDQIQLRLEDTFGIDQTTSAVVSFEENPYLTGLSFFSDILRATTEHKALQVTYQGFTQEEASTFDFHPWYLKQYNNRWFVLGYNAQYGGLSTLAIDRVQQLKAAALSFRPNSDYDFEEYFDDVIGVSFPEDAAVEVVKLRVASSLWPYIRSKPLHGSQKHQLLDDGRAVLSLRLVVNYEFISLLASFLERVEVLEPAHLRSQLHDRLQRASRLYK